MMRSIAVLRWALVPLLLCAGAALGQAYGTRAAGPLGAPRLLSRAELKSLEVVPTEVVSDAVWVLGEHVLVRRQMERELNRMIDEQSPARALACLRFALIDTNPDGQAALFSQACLADPKVCDNLVATVRAVANTRLVPPGNLPPWRMIEGHGGLR